MKQFLWGSILLLAACDTSEQATRLESCLGWQEAAGAWKQIASIEHPSAPAMPAPPCRPVDVLDAGPPEPQFVPDASGLFWCERDTAEVFWCAPFGGGKKTTKPLTMRDMLACVPDHIGKE